MEEWKQRLRLKREEKQMTKTAFAAAVGVSNATATDWEKSVDEGGIKEISGPRLTKISEVLGVDPRWLLHGRPSKAGEDDVGRKGAIEKAPQASDDRTAEEMLRRAVELIETYRLAGPTDRQRLDLVVREIRRKLGTVDKAKPGAS